MAFTSRIKSIIKRIIGRKAYVSDVQKLIEEGCVEVGTGCDLNAMTLFIPNRITGRRYIRIGNNCCVRGTIAVYNENAEVILGNNVYIGPQTYIECAQKVEIGSFVLISMFCNIIDTNSHSLHAADRRKDAIEWQEGLAYKDWGVVKSSGISIGDDCWIGLRSIIMKGVQLGAGTIVAAGSVVTKSTTPFVLVAGNPAQEIRQTD